LFFGSTLLVLGVVRQFAMLVGVMAGILGFGAPEYFVIYFITAGG
jgi:hypothetical protein